MIKRKKKSDKIVIDLDGPDGNAYCLLGYVHQICRNSGMTDDDTNNILSEMRKSDYYNLVAVMEKYFGSIIELHTENEELIIGINEAKNKLGP